ncbi:MAG: hypothetical protein FKY71_11385 [Spiribacter salinus]|uniref:Uncharacterized protein n=1 Tax=Spiribacter salinus TaxID=1335746 RepID=A0A540VQA4_9GAMM|nr:MAG: hypothetical protein FKY71_11385 [Spiribacter salinus]
MARPGGGLQSYALSIDYDPGEDPSTATWAESTTVIADNTELGAPSVSTVDRLDGSQRKTAAQFNYQFHDEDTESEAVQQARDVDDNSDSADAGSPVWLRVTYLNGDTVIIGGATGGRAYTIPVPLAAFDGVGGEIVVWSRGTQRTDDVEYSADAV